MALTIQEDGALGTKFVTGSILDPVAAPTDGSWQLLRGVAPFTVVVEGSGTFTASVRVSNQPTQPVSTDHGAPGASPDLTTPGARLIDGPYKWVKVRMITLTGGTVRADGFGILRGV